MSVGAGAEVRWDDGVVSGSMNASFGLMGVTGQHLLGTYGPSGPSHHDFLPGITIADPVSGSYDLTFGVNAYSYSMPVSGSSGTDGSVRVRTAVSRDPETGDVTPVTTVVLSTNPVTGTNLDLLRGNVYDPNNVGVGQELNGLDRIARENSVAGQTYGPPAPSGGNSSSGRDRDRDRSNDNDWRRPERDDNDDGPVGGNTQGVTHGSGGGANSTVGRGSGGNGTSENHSVGSSSGYDSRGVNDLDGPEAAGAGQAHQGQAAVAARVRAPSSPTTP